MEPTNSTKRKRSTGASTARATSGKSKSGSSDALWADLFSKAIACRVTEPVGEGWMTKKEFIKRCGVGDNKVSKILKRMREEGRIERFDGSQASGRRGTRQTWYRPIAK